ncbi:hypothetical protein ACTA71_005494 [Dictyostelium dimigraforme]
MSNNNFLNIFNNGSFNKELILINKELIDLLKNDQINEKLVIEKTLKLFSKYFNNNHSNNPFHFEEIIELLNKKLNGLDFIKMLVTVFSSNNGETNNNFKIYIINKLFQFLNNNSNNISLETIDFSPIKKFSNSFKQDIILVKKINNIEKHFNGNKENINNDEIAFDNQLLSSNLVFQNFCKSIDDMFSLDYLDMDEDLMKLVNDLEKDENKIQPLLLYLKNLERSTLEFLNLDLQYIILNNYNNGDNNLNRFKFYLYCLNKEIL